MDDRTRGGDAVGVFLAGRVDNWYLATSVGLNGDVLFAELT